MRRTMYVICKACDVELGSPRPMGLYVGACIFREKKYLQYALELGVCAGHKLQAMLFRAASTAVAAFKSAKLLNEADL